MGSFRRRLSQLQGLALFAVVMALPGAALAEVCATERPGWDGAPASVLDEAINLAATLPSLVLILATALALRFRSAKGGLAVVVLWTAWVSVIAFVGNATPVRQAAIQEGCIASPALFIGLVAAICVATILYTAPSERRSST